MWVSIATFFTSWPEVIKLGNRIADGIDFLGAQLKKSNELKWLNEHSSEVYAVIKAKTDAERFHALHTLQKLAAHMPPP